jgi:alpha-ketoglutarate-dependent taurine dioxygenase
MDQSVPVEELLAAARAVETTFNGIPSHPVPLRSRPGLSAAEVHWIVGRYNRHGFAVFGPVPGSVSAETPAILARALLLGDPFVPPLYTLGGRQAAPVSRISAAFNSGTDQADHPSFGRTVGQRLHCDGTLQEIGLVKASLLLCESPACDGGETILFNSSAAYAELAAADPPAAVALAAPGVLVRRANIHDCTEANTGPAFTVQRRQLVARYCVTETDSWVVPDQVQAEDVYRGVEFLRRAAEPGSSYYARLTLDAGQAIVIDNTRISHGRMAYRDSPDRRRCLYRCLYLRHPQQLDTSVAQAHPANASATMETV